MKQLKLSTGGTQVVMTVYSTHVTFSSAPNNLPSNLMIMDILMFQPDPQDSEYLPVVVRRGNEFQSLLFSSQSSVINEVVKCLGEAVSENQMVSSRIFLASRSILQIETNTSRPLRSKDPVRMNSSRFFWAVRR